MPEPLETDAVKTTGTPAVAEIGETAPTTGPAALAGWETRRERLKKMGKNAKTKIFFCILRTRIVQKRGLVPKNKCRPSERTAKSEHEFKEPRS
jgi:hypothetical protein